MDINILLETPSPFGLACTPWWWIWTFGAFLLGWLLHWLLNRDKQALIDKLTAERDNYKGLAAKWEKDYISLKYQLEESQKAEADLRASLRRCESDKAVLNTRLAAGAATETAPLGIAAGLGAAGMRFGALFTNDNLQIIEGVGPKIESLLQNAGYSTWEKVAAASYDDLKKVLDDAGSRFQLADPTSWPHQASLAVAGEWEELIRYQKFTDAGRETTGDFETDSKFEKLAAKKMGFSSTNPEDLKVVEGIGPKIEQLFKAEGIKTWADLAATATSRMQEILDAAGDRYRLADPGTWAQQAGLAAAGKWEQLSTLQDQLKGGK